MGRRRGNLLSTLITAVLKPRTEHDRRRLLRATRLVAAFGVLIVLPVALLAYLALSTTQGSATVEAELAPRAATLLRQILADEREVFGRFETSAERRLLRNQSPVNALDDLSPHLVAAYQLDPAATLEEPFDLPDPSDPAEPTARFERAWRAAVRAEQGGELAEALASYAAAAEATDSRRLQGQARLAQARVATRLQLPEPSYADVIGDYGSLRDSRGFRLGDLARLNQAELALERSPDGAIALRELVDVLLGSRWVLFEGGEPTIARHAVTRLEEVRARGGPVDPDWLTSVRRRLEQRDAQLYWSGALFEELQAVTQPLPRPEDGVVYRSSSGNQTLWALRATRTGWVVYAFDRDGIVDRLKRTASRLAELDPDFVATVGPADPDLDGPTVFRRNSERLPGLEFRVSAADPDGLAAARNTRVATRILIVLLAIATSVIGIAVTVRYVSKELETARVKADFAANVSHELRSPITQIRLKAEALQLDLVFRDEDRRAHYDAIVRESERLSRLVDNVLDFASIERGAKRYTFRPEDPVGLLYTSLESHQAAFAAANMRIEADIPDDLPVIRLDREAITQVFTNLFSNAVKYGSEGGWIGVTARTVGDAVEFRVADRGMGIAAEDRSRVFEDFFRSADPAVRRMKGTGIGLTIVRYIVEAHGGRITVESTPGRGATFVVVLPIEPPPAPGA
jgi:two-component system phosphate regulon sensor histidine kinase PhoR